MTSSTPSWLSRFNISPNRRWGEVLDRVDDDTQEIATLRRLQMWQFACTAFSLAPLWGVAGLTWWPAWIIFLLFAGLTYLVTKPLLAPIAELKVVEEAAWTDHAAALEEGVAGRDDARTSLAQPFLISRLTRLSAVVHERVKAVVLVECRLLLRAGAVLHGLLAVIVVVGAALVWSGHESIGSLVTLFLVTTGFVGALSQLSEQMPEMQAGLGAVMRLRQLMAVPSEAHGGDPVPQGMLELRFEHLDFSYVEGIFGLRDVTMTLPAGETLALVGRTFSGKSMLASLVSRAVAPPLGTVFLGGVDLQDIDLESLRTTVGVVTQRKEILTGTLAENIMLFEDMPRARLEDIIERLRLTAWVESLPDGIDTPLGAGGTSLSAGEEHSLDSWHARCASSCSTRRRRAWVLSPRRASWPPRASRYAGVPASSSLTAWVRSRVPTGSPSSTAADSSRGDLALRSPRCRGVSEIFSSRPGPRWTSGPHRAPEHRVFRSRSSTMLPSQPRHPPHRPRTDRTQPLPPRSVVRWRRLTNLPSNPSLRWRVASGTPSS